MSKNTIDDRMKDAGIVFHPSDIEMDTERAEYFQQALYQDLMALVGEDEPFKNLYQWEQAEPINLEKQRIRRNINQYFGKENQ